MKKRLPIALFAVVVVTTGLGLLIEMDAGGAGISPVTTESSAAMPVSSPASVNPAPEDTAPGSAVSGTPAPDDATPGGQAPTGALPGLTASGPVTVRSGQTLRGLRISNPGGSCVVVPAGATDVIIENSEIGPCGTTVNDLGVEIRPKAQRITVRGNVIHDVASGIHATAALNPIVIEHNRVFDVRGPMPRGQMVQFDQVTGPGSSRVVGNVSDRQAATITTRYEDHISLYKSSGTAGSPILIACNKIRGGDSATGSGIMTGDHGGGWIEIRNNVVVLTTNAGIGVAGGHDVTVSGNLVYARGATAASKTDQAMTVFTYAGIAPRNVTLTGNRTASNLWLHGGVGQLGPGLWTDGTGTNLVDRQNTWQDLSLSPAIWNTSPSVCH